MTTSTAARAGIAGGRPTRPSHTDLEMTMTDNPPTDLCPSCRHPRHLPGTECQSHVNHGPSRFHLCLCLARPGAALSCPPQMTCQGGTLGYADVWYLQQGHSLSSDDGVISPEVLKTGPVAVGFPSTETDAVAADLEGIRRALAAVATDRPTPEQIAEWNTADKEMAQRVRAALPGVPLHHVYAVLRASRTLQRMDAAAAVPAAPGRSDDGLRARLVAAIREAACVGDCGLSEAECVGKRPQASVWHRGVLAEVLGSPEAFADAVLPVLPTGADRATVLREAANALACVGPETLASGPQAWTEAIETLRRMAAEAQQPGVPRCPACGHSICDGDGACGALLDAWQRCTCTGSGAEAQQQPDTEMREETGAALARYIADRPVSELQAALRILGRPPLRLELTDETGDDHSCAESGCTGEPGPVEGSAAADTGEETDAIWLDEDGRDVETGHLPGCASQSYPDPGICYCGETGRG